MRPTSLRQEIVLWYSLVLLIALTAFASLSYLILRESLERAGTASLRQTALTAEQLIAPPAIPRLDVREELIAPRGTEVQALRRRTRLITGEEVDIYVAGSRDVSDRALRSLVAISLILIPLTAGAAAIGGRAIANRLLRPLDRLVTATREIEIGGLSRRVEEPRQPAELHELARGFNGMLTRLERAVGTLRQFTADASHELRTPLTAIKGTVQVALARERSAEELRSTLVDVGEETDWMLHLVEGLLTLARGDEVGPGPVHEPTDLRPLLEDVRELGEALAAEKPVEVQLESGPSAWVRASPAALRQVFVNLMSNAIKFTDRGSVRIAVTLGEWVEVHITDTGRGIPPDELPRVFERFFRGDAARSRAGGAGLGLAIARLIAEQLGGSIEAESTPGQGSTFHVRLPPAQPTA